MSSVSAINSLLSGTAPTTPSINISSILASATGATTPGIDVTAAVAAGIYADRAPERIWQADQVTLSNQTTALTAIQAATGALVADMQSLNTLTGPLAARTATSSNFSEVTATAVTGTVAGVHTVVVSKLASTGSWYSDLEKGVTGATDPLLKSSFSITSASGYSATFQTGDGIGTAGKNLTDLAATINANKNLGVTATVVSDSTGSRLAIISNTSGNVGDFSVTTPYTGTSWASPIMPTSDTLGVNSVTLTSGAGTATIDTISGETYSQLATAINNATITSPPTSYSSTLATVTSATFLTVGSVTSIQDNVTGKTFSYTAVAGNTVATLNAAIAGAVTSGTLSANVTGVVSTGGKEVVSEGLTDKGITVSTTDSVLGAMNAAPGATTPLGLTATASSDVSGTSLSIVSTSPFTINQPSVNTPSFGFTQAVSGTNAALTVDGVPISSASNSVTGAVRGVTFTLLGASPGVPVSLTVASDASQASNSINQFVADYNTALRLVNSQFTVTGSSSSQGVLGSDPTLRALQGALLHALNYVNTPATGTTTVSTLSALGINANNDGSLTINSAALNNALINNASDVQNFFEGASLNGFAASVNKGLAIFTDPANGSFKVDLSGISKTSAALTKQINDLEMNYIANQQTVLTAMYSKAEIALQQLPTQIAQLQSMLGMNSKSGG